MKAEQFFWLPGKGWNNQVPSVSPEVSLVFIFGHSRLSDSSTCFESVRENFPKAKILGCSTAGEISGTRVHDDSIVVSALTFASTQVISAGVDVDPNEDCFEAGAKLARQLPADGLRHVIVFSEGLRINGSRLVAGLSENLPKNVGVTGGFAGDGDRLTTTHIWTDTGSKPCSVVAIGLYSSRLRVGVAVTGSWGPFGPDRLITRSRQNILYELDGRPALELYKEYLGKYAQGLPATGLMFPLEITGGSGQQRRLRAILGVNETDQSITFAGDIPEGSYSRMMIGHVEQMILGSGEAAKASRISLGEAVPQFSLLVSCNGRRMVLKQRVDEEVEAVNEYIGGQSVITGFYSYGEIGPAFGNGSVDLHNETMVITHLAEV
jgi:hypothetical protein